VWVEQEPGSGGKESAENTIANLAGYTIRADKVTGDKITRAGPLAAQAEVGNVVLVRGAWNELFLSEAQAYEEEAPFKDQIDAAAGAFNKLTAGRKPVVVGAVKAGDAPGAGPARRGAEQRRRSCASSRPRSSARSSAWWRSTARRRRGRSSAWPIRPSRYPRSSAADETSRGQTHRRPRDARSARRHLAPGLRVPADRQPHAPEVRRRRLPARLRAGPTRDGAAAAR
jgi:hypothetical protein